MQNALVPYIAVIAGFALLYFGADWLVRGSAVLARRVGMSALVVGLTVVAFGTSAPELAVSVDAALKGRSNIALGNVVGSNIANIGLILGSAALIQRLTIRAQTARVDVRIVVAISILVPLLLLDGRLGRIEGGILSFGLVAYIVFIVLLSHRARATVEAEYEEALPVVVQGVWREIAMIVGGMALLIAGAEAMVRGAISIAEQFHISTAIIGLTVVALGTSLPEFATSIVAAVRKEGDIVVGNVLGSNIFNLLGIVGISSMVAPIQPTEIRPADMLVMVLMAVALLPMMRTGRCLTRFEGGLLLSGYFAYIGYLVGRAGA